LRVCVDVEADCVVKLDMQCKIEPMNQRVLSFITKLAEFEWTS